METHARITPLDVDLGHHQGSQKIRRGVPPQVSQADGSTPPPPRRRSESVKPASIARGNSRHAFLHVLTSRATQFVDITDRLEAILATCGVRARLINVQTLHTTTGIVVNEHEPLLLADFERLLEKTVPQATAYWHDEMPLRPSVAADERRNGHAHCRALLLPSSAVLTIVDGALRLGRWQRVFLAEFDGPRERELSVVILGETAL